MFLMGAIFSWGLLRPVSLLPAIPVLILFLMAISADLTSYSHGADDNATGAAITIGLAERFAKAPLTHTKVWAVNPGCEEVGSYGSTARVESHREELDDAIYLTLDNVGGAGAGPCYLTKETLIFPFSSDSNLIKPADRLTNEHPELGAFSREMKAAYTDGAIGIKAGFRCLTFVGYTPEGVIPDWHHPGDLFDNVDWDVVERTEKFVWLLMQELDNLIS
jgi:hypothetical protein